MIIILFLGFSGCVPPDSGNNEPQINKPDNETITLAATGDIMMHNTQIASGRGAGGTYDFTRFFNLVSPIISEADYTSVCFEAPMAGASYGYSGYPRFNCPDEFAQALKSAGYNLVVTANNHILDMGYRGSIRTLDVLARAGLETAGTYRSGDESGRVLIKDIRGVKVGYLAYTYSTNGLSVPKGAPFTINYLDKPGVLSDIAELRPNVDVLVVVLHWGVEYSPQPTEQQKEFAREFLSAGADVILGSHPHVIEPMEIIKDGEKEKLVVYSMGNFLADQNGLERNSGIILKVKFTKNLSSGETRLSEASYTPTYCYHYLDRGHMEFRVIPAESSVHDLKEGRVIPGLGIKDIPVLEQVINDTRERLDKAYYMAD